jgi:hypothetical protein
MSTRAQRNRRAKKSRYLLLAALGLLSLIAYTMNNNASKSSGFDQIAQPSQLKSKSHQTQDVMAPFTQRWQQAQTDIENYLMDDGFKKTRYFFDGYNVASNDEFELPTEETGAGNGTDQHIQDLSDAIVADLVPTGYSSGGPSSSGAGAGGGAGGGRGSDNNRTQYVATEDLQEDDNGNKTDGGSSNGDVSAVPVPPAIWLLSSALIGLMGLRRKQVH